MMNKDEDFRIQEILNQKMKGNDAVFDETTNTADLKAYQLLYEQLGTAPTEHLSFSFKANVLKRIKIEKKKTNDTLFYWAIAAIFLMGIIAIISIFFVFKDAFMPILNILDQLKGFIVIALAALLLFNVVERKSIRIKL